MGQVENTSDDRVLRTLRMQAWGRVKGELTAVLVTYWPGNGTNFEAIDTEIAKFISAVEDNGLVE